jgi:diguanylate cyclase (GGDEF)-like protein
MMRRLERALGSGTIRARLSGITAVLIVVIGGVMWTDSRSTALEHSQALIDNVAGRPPMYVERYVSEVLLVSTGFTADPGSTRDTLVHTAAALLDGGAVLAVQGNDYTIHLPQQTDPSVRAKLAEFSRLVGQLTSVGDRIETEQPGTLGYRQDTDKLIALSHVTANVGHDAVGRMTTLANRTVAADARRLTLLAGIGILLALLLTALVGQHLVRRLQMLTKAARAAAAGDLTVHYMGSAVDEVGQLGSAFNDMTDSLATLVNRLEAQAEGDKFRTQLAEALEITDDAEQAFKVIELALAEIDPATPAELLMADSSRAHLTRVASNQAVAAPGCPVQSPYSCVAVRRGGTLVTTTSDALNACPSLRGRPGGACSAVCVPVTFMGRPVGVLHATGVDGQTPEPRLVEQLTTLAVQSGTRIGTVRSFQESQLQANTDLLTGLLNRRSLENTLRNLLRDAKPFALAMADLDEFKQLNDTYGHEAGDRALRVFSRTVQEAVRTHDIVARYGGEEFVLIFPEADIAQAVELLDRLRVTLAAALHSFGGPAFTASFGVTDTSVATTLEDLLRTADTGLMTAKSEGRNRVVPVLRPTSASVSVGRIRAEEPEERLSPGTRAQRNG